MLAGACAAMCVYWRLEHNHMECLNERILEGYPLVLIDEGLDLGICSIP